MSSVSLYTQSNLALHAAVNIVKNKSQDLNARVSSCANGFIAHLKHTFANMKQACSDMYTRLKNGNNQNLKQITGIVLTTAGALGTLSSIATLNITGLIFSGSVMYAGMNLMNKS